MIDDYNMDERMESSCRLLYYRVSGEPGIAGCSRRSDIYPGECGLAHTSLFIDRRCVSLNFALKFRSWLRPRNYFNSEIFLIYGTLTIYCLKFEH